MENTKFINDTEAAEYLQVSPKTLYAKVSKKEIPASWNCNGALRNLINRRLRSLVLLTVYTLG